MIKYTDQTIGFGMCRTTPRNEASEFNETRYILLQHFTDMKFIIVDLLQLLLASFSL